MGQGCGMQDMRYKCGCEGQEMRCRVSGYRMEYGVRGWEASWNLGCRVGVQGRIQGTGWEGGVLWVSRLQVPGCPGCGVQVTWMYRSTSSFCCRM